MASVTIINIKDRVDRKQHILRQCKHLGIKEVHFFHPMKHPKGGAFGCYESHVAVWKQCYNKDPKSKFYFVGEDDFQENSVDCKTVLRKAVKFMNKNYKHIDVLHLHDYCAYHSDVRNNSLFSLGQGQCMHAYFISREYVKKIIDNIPPADGTHIDYTIVFDNTHALYTPRQFYMRETCLIQADITSDNVNTVADNLTRHVFDLHNRVVVHEQFYRYMQPLLSDEQFCNLHHKLYRLSQWN
jgi:GR25 family glycosyltransferase involved in LPS biosynthesis